MTSTDAAAAATEVDDFIARAVQAANPNTLRVTLYQLTGDLELMDMERVRIPVRGGA
jgi:4-hydroxyacetophenone monooxygenase